MKLCKKCNTEKDEKKFSIDNSRKDKLFPYCKECESKRKKIYCENNKDKLRMKKKLYLENNKEEIKLRKKRYYEENKPLIKIKQRIYYENNKERINLRNRKYNEKNRKKINKIGKEYYQNNKPKIYKYLKNRRDNDPEFKLMLSLRNSINRVLRKNIKSDRTEKLLGCSIEYFKKWIEEWFDDNMNWDNYGSYWHIDHIIQCSEFELKNSEEQEICFHYTNLRPLEKTINLSKRENIREEK